MQFSSILGHDCHVVSCMGGGFFGTDSCISMEHRCVTHFNGKPLGSFYGSGGWDVSELVH